VGFKVARYVIKFLNVLTCSLRPEKLALLPKKNNCLGDIAMATVEKSLFTDHQFGIRESRTRPDYFTRDDYIRRNQ